MARQVETDLSQSPSCSDRVGSSADRLNGSPVREVSSRYGGSNSVLEAGDYALYAARGDLDYRPLNLSTLESSWCRNRAASSSIRPQASWSARRAGRPPSSGQWRPPTDRRPSMRWSSLHRIEA